MSHILKENRIRKVIESGGVALGCGTQTFSPAVIEVIGLSGMDFVWVDLEHAGMSPYDSLGIENLVRAADSVGISVLLRIPSCDEFILGKVLDTGVHAILVPGIDKKKDAQKLVASTRFSPPGRATIRSAGLARAGGWRGVNQAFAEWSDRQVMVGLMFESRKAIDSANEVLSVEGIDFVFMGPLDLSVSLGVPYQTKHPLVTEYIARGTKAARERGIITGFAMSYLAGNDADALKMAIDDGHRLIRVGFDLGFLANSLQALVEAAPISRLGTTLQTGKHADVSSRKTATEK